MKNSIILAICLLISANSFAQVDFYIPEWTVQAQENPKGTGKMYNNKPVGEWEYFNEFYYDSPTEIFSYDTYILKKISHNDRNKIKAIGSLNTDFKKTGNWKEFHENGNIKAIGNYKNGNSDGEWITYNEKGEIVRKSNYIDGNKNGISIYIDDEKEEYKVRTTSNYKNDIKNGKEQVEILYDGKEMLYQIINYDNGHKSGEQITYNDKGIIATIESFDGVNYYPYQLVKNYDNGNIQFRMTLDNKVPVGTVYYFHANGKELQKTEIKDGKIYNIFDRKDENGNPQDFGDFKDGQGTVNNYENGQLTLKQVYENSEIVEITNYSNQLILSVVSYKNGDIYKQANYENGVIKEELTGNSKTIFENGIIHFKTEITTNGHLAKETFYDAINFSCSE